MKTANRTQSLIPLLAVYMSVAVFLLPGSDAITSGQDEAEIAIDHTRTANYDIQVSLEPDSKVLSGRETINWTNNGGAATDELILNLYFNNFTADTPTRSQETNLPPGEMVEIKSVSFAEGVDLTSNMQIDGSTMKLSLPEPVQPGEVIRLEVDFNARLPEITERAGHTGSYYIAGHWYPKMAVYLDGKWINSESPANSDLFADFGNYRVDITVPKSFEVGATGKRIRARTDPNTKTLTYAAYPVYDFAWVASPHFRRSKKDFQYDVGGEQKNLEVHLLMQRDNTDLAESYFEVVEKNLEVLNTNYGEFPYKKLLIVDPASGEGLRNAGQDYPMLATAGASWVDKNLLTGGQPLIRDISKVFSDQYWNASIGSNQNREQWLSKGISAYVSNQVIDSTGPFTRNTTFAKIYFDFYSTLHPFRWDFDFNYWNLTSLLKAGLTTSTLSEARLEYIKSPSFDPVTNSRGREYNPRSAKISSTIKPDLIFRNLETIVGKQTVARVLSRYYNSHRFSKASGGDLKILFSDISGQDLGWYFDQVLDSNKVLDYAVTSISGNTIHCERRGEIILPQTLLVNLENGQSFKITWPLPMADKQIWMDNYSKAVGAEGALWRLKEGLNGKWLKVEIKSESPVLSAQLDPESAYVLDINFANNSFSTIENRVLADRTELAWVRILGRWFHGISTYN